MQDMKRGIFGLLLLVLAPSLVLAQKQSIKLPEDNPISRLKPGLGREKVLGACSLCHSTDYIVGQPRMDAARWEAEVKKMNAVFGARIPDADAKLIADYLAKNYGPEATSEKPNSDADKR